MLRSVVSATATNMMMVRCNSEVPISQLFSPGIWWIGFLTILATFGAISGGVLNYKDAKENIIEIQNDFSSLFSAVDGNQSSYDIEEFNCKMRDPEGIIKALDALNN